MSETIKALRDIPHKIQIGENVITEAPKTTPMVAEVDVLVVGGGPAGVGAALAASREGAKTLLIERHNVLGGMWTAGLVNPFFEFKGRGWIVTELVERLESLGSWRDVGFRTFDTESMSILLEQMMAEAGAEYWYDVLMVDTIIQGNQVRGVVIECKAGREAILAKVVIDCSGDGDVAARAGAQYELGRISDGNMQPMTLMFEVEGIGNVASVGGPALYDQLTEAIKEHQLDVNLPFGRRSNVPWILGLPRTGSAVVQATHVYGLSPLDPRQLTKAISDMREQVSGIIKALQHVPGYELIRLVRTAPAIGVRETRRILGDYRLTLDDLYTGRRFEDSVASCGFGVDVHDVKAGEQSPTDHGPGAVPYEIPYRCLLPKEIDGMLVAGRCISGSHEAHASYRVTGTCMAIGQAAGLAGAWAAVEGKQPRDLSGSELHKKLGHRGVGFLP